MEAQTRLLRVLNDNKFIAVGDDPSKSQPFHARIICATNKDIPSLIKEEKFREDLYYRINTFHLALPSLQCILRGTSEATKIDLIRAFVRDVAEDLSDLPDIDFTDTELTSKAFAKLSSYNFPGNYRELTSVLIRSISNMILLGKNKLDVNSIVLPNDYSKCLAQKTDIDLIDIDVNSLNYQEIIARVELVSNTLLAKKIKALLLKHEGFISDAAAEAGFGSGKYAITKFNKLTKKYGIKWRDFRKDSRKDLSN